MTDILIQRLRLAKREELFELLVDLKLKLGTYKGFTDAKLVDAIAEELRSAASNSFATPFRAPLTYREILRDVADKLTPGIFTSSKFKVLNRVSARTIEHYIAEQVEKRIAELISAKLKDKGEVEKRELEEELVRDMRSKGVEEIAARSTATALIAGTLTVPLGPLVASVLFSSLWTTLFGLSLAQVLLGGLVVGGPVAAAAAALAILASPSYSKVVPAVYRIIMIRKNAEQKERLGVEA